MSRARTLVRALLTRKVSSYDVDVRESLICVRVPPKYPAVGTDVDHRLGR